MHIPVLLTEVLSFLNPQSGQIFVDATVGLGGHARALLERSSPDGKLIGFEQDPQNYALAAENLKEFGNRVILFQKNFSELQTALEKIEISAVDGILFDLGISSAHLDTPERGFSFRREGPLDMRLNPENPVPTAADILNAAAADDLERIFREYGEEPQARFLAAEIVRKRMEAPFRTTIDLADFIQKIAPHKKRLGGGHPAALVFQALRIAVNDELRHLESALPQAFHCLKKGGKVVVISFHSLEDRVVKNFLRRYAKSQKRQKYPVRPDIPEKVSVRLLSSKPIAPSPQEVEENPRARSARLRAAEKI